ncbi:MAG: DUF5702 domain-containing protein [Clostridiales bacterium]|nr:DUF5702 domain-containing protein [Clostridiales bacterium]
MAGKRRSGSITVFAALSFMLVGQMIFSLLELARSVEFHKVLQMDADSVIESEFAEYVTPLWETYRLLGTSVEDGDGEFSLATAEGKMKEVSEVNLTPSGGFLSGTTLLAASVTDAQITTYKLITDDGGTAYEESVCAYMQKNFLYDEAKAIWEKYEDENSDLSSSDTDTDGDALKEALDAIESAEEAAEAGDGSAAETSSYAQQPAIASDLPSASAERGFQAVTLTARTLSPVMSREPSSGTVRSVALDADSGSEADAGLSEADAALAEKGNNLLNSVSSTKGSGILTIVFPQGTTFSGTSLTSSETVSVRTLESGNDESTDSSGLWGDACDKVLLIQYLLHYMADYTNPSDSSAMAYELEYLIAGNPSDPDNLKAVINEILAMREASNLASLMQSSTKQAEAEAMAAAIAAAVLNPELTPVIEAGILAAWAYVESVLDLRALMQGEKISMVKGENDWTSSLENIGSLLSEGFPVAKSCSSGMTYKDYLSLLLYTKTDKTLSMRAMDLQEAAIRKVSGYSDFRMDCVMVSATVDMTYSYKPVFLGFVTLVEHSGDGYQITKTTDYSYTTDKGNET